MPKIERAILSCHDKQGIVELATFLDECGVELITTSGTQEVLAAAGITAISIAEFTGVQEMMDGRVKSLHPKVHAGLLGLRDSKLHCEQMQAFEMQWVDLVVVNLHPIRALTEDPALTSDEVVERVDIGGMAMLRSAAKNFRYVTAVVNPEHYPTIIHEMRAHEGGVAYTTRYRLAQEAFACTADYDRILAEYLQRTQPPED
jgi:phosphoribosylaminoimidazolecarboxamide formyltransferase/IMP cyclohydrolase